jgi:hypothetical protein
MARTLHLIKSDDNDLATTTIARQRAAGEMVSVAVLHGARIPSLPSGVVVHRVPDDLSWEQLLQAMFEADQVLAW